MKNRYDSILENNSVYREAYNSYVAAHNGTHSLYLHGLAPVMIEFVRWVLFSAVAAGKKRLYFLARDGWQMYMAAQHIVERYHMDIECRYLKVSRYAVRVPEYHLLGASCVERICVGGIDVTFGKLMERAGLSHGQGLAVAGECGYANRYDEILDYQEIKGIKEILRNHQGFLAWVYEQSRLAYPAAVGYFKQEGLLDGTAYALVDSGWTGSLQQSIKNLCASALGCDAKTFLLQGYYFGLYELPDDEDKSCYHSFYFGPRDNMRRKVYFSNSLFEAVFSAPHGMTHHYEEHQGKYVAVFDMKDNPNGDAIEAYARQLAAFMELCSDLSVPDSCAAWDYKLVEALLFQLMAKPAKEEVEVFGNILFCDDVLENSMQEVSVALSDDEIKNQHLANKLLIKSGLKKGVLRESAWIEGSIVKKGVKVKRNLRHAAMYKYFVYIRKLLK